ncbi:MAG: hypothetical protein IPG91_15370 [Ideonella sp.]|jgi:hypothetical protein|nr:hypothetical protein [Betaproteobacteria bacterium]MBK6864822.1 hypothetical protein [Ideonella sp.]
MNSFNLANGLPADQLVWLQGAGQGGTTERSKGVRLSYVNIFSNAVAFGPRANARREHVYLHAAPMFYSADLLAMGW